MVMIIQTMTMVRYYLVCLPMSSLERMIKFDKKEIYKFLKFSFYVLKLIIKINNYNKCLLLIRIKKKLLYFVLLMKFPITIGAGPSPPTG
jgi:hypothetical protein